MKLKHKIALFIVYLIIFAVSIAMIDYYAYLTLNGYILTLISIVLALIATFLHIQYYKKYKIKTKADELAKEIEEIL